MVSIKTRTSRKGKLRRKFTKAENHAKNIARHMLTRRSFSRFLRILGPGLVTGAADDDPSGTLTYSQAGAGFGFGFLWVFPFTYPLLIAVQEACSRIGAVTGKGLAALLREHYSRKLLYGAVFLVVVANVINIGADLGAMVSTTQLFIKLPFPLLAVLYAILIILLLVFVSYKRYAKILKWLAVALFAYTITAFMVNLNWLDVIRQTFLTVPKIDATTIYILVGVLGTTISPYCFFWDTSEVVEEEISQHRLSKSGNDPKISRKYLKGIRLDNFWGMTLSIITAWFIVVTCAGTLYLSGVRNINTAADAAQALEPLVRGFPYAGFLAKFIFSVGIIGIGLLAVPVLAGSSAYAITETLGWREGLYRKFKKAIGFYVVIIAATLVGLIINFIGIDPIQALIFSAVFNGIAAVPLIWLVIRVANNREIMHEYKSSKLSNIFSYLAFFVMTFAVIALFYFTIKGGR